MVKCALLVSVSHTHYLYGMCVLFVQRPPGWLLRSNLGTCVAQQGMGPCLLACRQWFLSSVELWNMKEERFGIHFVWHASECFCESAGVHKCKKGCNDTQSSEIKEGHATPKWSSYCVCVYLPACLSAVCMSICLKSCNNTLVISCLNCVYGCIAWLITYYYCCPIGI